MDETGTINLMQTLSIIIPVYNEGQSIKNVIDSVIGADSLGLKKEIILVDDGSTDNTEIGVRRLVDSYNSKKPNLQSLISIRLPLNKGKGAALKEGFKHATGDILLVQDADSEYSVTDYPALLSPFINNNAQVVYGTRNKKRKTYHTKYSYFSFYIGGIILTKIINFMYGTKLSDQATGYKLFVKSLKNILLLPQENRFSYEVAVTALLAKNHIPFQEVPIHYTPRTMKEGKKINALDFISSIIVAIQYK